jgi:hypothetical protein
VMRLQAASGRREMHLRRSKSERSAKRAPALKRTHASGSRPRPACGPTAVIRAWGSGSGPFG